MNNKIISTFPKRKMTERDILNYLNSNNELIILSSYALCSLDELRMNPHIKVTLFYIDNMLNEYGGTFNEYLIICKI